MKHTTALVTLHEWNVAVNERLIKRFIITNMVNWLAGKPIDTLKQFLSKY
jgi:hypothetical protein